MLLTQPPAQQADSCRGLPSRGDILYSDEKPVKRGSPASARFAPPDFSAQTRRRSHPDIISVYHAGQKQVHSLGACLLLHKPAHVTSAC
jgi:hypothetical protein